MKFVFVVPRYHINLHYRVQALLDHGHEVKVLAMYKGKSEEHGAVEPEILGYSWCFKLFNKIFNKNQGRLMKNQFELTYSHPDFFKTFFKIKKINPDVLVIKNIQSIYSIFALIIGKLLRKKIFVLLQIDKYRPKQKSVSVDLVGKIFGAKVLTPILGDRKYNNKNQNLFYLPFPVEVKDFDKQYFKDNKINIVCVGKFQERKGHLILAQAINQLKDYFDFKVTLIGEEDEGKYTQDLVTYIEEHNLSEIIERKINLPHGELMEFFKTQDVLVLPSWDEAASVSIAEAMAHKLAVLSTYDNGTRCYIHEGENGYLFKERNVDDLFDKLKKIASDTDKLVAMGQKSFALAQEYHTMDKFYEKFVKLI
ncbi:glycosyltransferase [Candidatus Parcubacteria bacterium]|nr:MAG: glycosyltransferase [Candidatus Parcubacteria bacterium]